MPSVSVCNINDVLDGHVTLDIECLDRIYLNAYVPKLQVSGQVVTFLTEHRANPIPSPALFTKIGNDFRKAVMDFAADKHIPVIRFSKGDRKIEVMRPYLDKATTPGIVAIGVAQEFQSVFTGYKRPAATPGPPHFSFAKADRRVTVYYFTPWWSRSSASTRASWCVTRVRGEASMTPRSRLLSGSTGGPPTRGLLMATDRTSTSPKCATAS